MEQYRIAELLVRMAAFGETLTSQASAYRATTDQGADLTIRSARVTEITPVGAERRRTEGRLVTGESAHHHVYTLDQGAIKMHSSAHVSGREFNFDFSDTLSSCPGLGLADWEYLATGFAFAKALLEFDGFVVHASAVAMDDAAVLFSAPCGTGKSTQAALWQRFFGAERAVILNDDKPAIRRLGDDFFAFGTPWSGKTPLNENRKVPLRAIVFLEQAKDNEIRRLSSREAVPLLIQHSLGYGDDQEKAGKLLTILDRMMSQVQIYSLRCNTSEQAVLTAYKAIFGDGHRQGRGVS